MTINKYKVVCSQPQFSDHVYIDIAPSQGIIHDQIFFSRIQLHRQISTQPLSRLYGSIYLTDNNGDINVEFPSPQARKNTPDYQSCLKQYANLEQQIIECYKEMLKSGGSDYPINIVKKSGVDFTKMDAINGVITRYKELLDELEKALNE